MANVSFALKDKKEAVQEAKRILKRKEEYFLIEWSDSFGGIGPHKDHVFKEHKLWEFF